MRTADVREHAAALTTPVRKEHTSMAIRTLATLTLMALIGAGALAVKANANTCTTNCYGSGNYRSCTTSCY
jgi:hypothetical protein